MHAPTPFTNTRSEEFSCMVENNFEVLIAPSEFELIDQSKFDSQYRNNLDTIHKIINMKKNYIIIFILIILFLLLSNIKCKENFAAKYRKKLICRYNFTVQLPVIY